MIFFVKFPKYSLIKTYIWYSNNCVRGDKGSESTYKISQLTVVPFILIWLLFLTFIPINKLDANGLHFSYVVANSLIQLNLCTHKLQQILIVSTNYIFRSWQFPDKHFANISTSLTHATCLLQFPQFYHFNNTSTCNAFYRHVTSSLCDPALGTNLFLNTHNLCAH
jgi:hypothetical protein